MHIGVEVAHVFSVTVSQTCGGKSLAVVVNDHGTKNNFVSAIPIDISNSVVMITLSLPWTVGVVVPLPTYFQLVGGRVHIVSNHLMTGVDASCQEDAGLATIQIRCAEEELRSTVSVSVTPCSIEVGLA